MLRSISPLLFSFLLVFMIVIAGCGEAIDSPPASQASASSPTIPASVSATPEATVPVPMMAVSEDELVAQIEAVLAGVQPGLRNFLEVVASGADEQAITQAANAYSADLRSTLNQIQTLEPHPALGPLHELLVMEYAAYITTFEASAGAYQRGDPIGLRRAMTVRPTTARIESDEPATSLWAACLITPNFRKLDATLLPSASWDLQNYVREATPRMTTIEQGNDALFGAAFQAQWDASAMLTRVEAYLPIKHWAVTRLTEVKAPGLTQKLHARTLLQYQKDLEADQLLVEGLKTGDAAVLRRSTQATAQANLAAMDMAAESLMLLYWS